MSAETPESPPAEARPKPAVPEGSLVYAIGDIHGCLRLLEALHEKILADAEGRPEGRKVVIYLGDYVDRGPESRQVIDLLLDDPLPGFEAVHLKGNHEDLMLDFLDDPAQGPGWIVNGGVATLASYDVVPKQALPLSELLAGLHADFRAALPERHRAFLAGLGLHHTEGDYAFVHAGIRPGVPLAAQSEEDLLWIREEFLWSSASHGRVVVHGHTPVTEPDIRPNRIGIDTGAVLYGVLTCLALDGEERRLLQVREPV